MHLVMLILLINIFLYKLTLFNLTFPFFSILFVLVTASDNGETKEIDNALLLKCDRLKAIRRLSTILITVKVGHLPLCS